MEHARGEVGQADGERMLGRFGEPDRLGFVPGRFGESAEFGEAHDQPGAIPDRWRASKSEILVDPVGRQRGEVAGGQFNHPIILTPDVMRLREIACGEDAKSQVPEAPGDLQRAGAGRERLVQLAELRVDVAS